MSQTPEAAGTLPATLDESGLKALGLGPADLPRIEEIGKALQDITPGNLHVFGTEAASKTAAFSSQLLDQVRNRDLDASGDKLGEVVRIARTLNLDKFGARSKVPVIGPLIDRFKVSKGELVQKFSTTNQQIEQLMRDVGAVQSDLGLRVKDFDKMHDLVLEERHELGLHVAAGRIRLAELEARHQSLAGQEEPEARLQRTEVDNAIRLLDKRVGDLVMLQHSAEQTLPMIRIIQANAIQLIEKFNAVRDITIPSWRRHFAIQLSLNEQKNAVDLANSIDDANNELLRKNADLVHSTSVATAKANQRAVIDIQTLKHVHEKLISTVEEVRAIHRDGIQSRKQAEHDLALMKEDVQKRLAAPTAGA